MSCCWNCVVGNKHGYMPAWFGSLGREWNLDYRVEGGPLWKSSCFASQIRSEWQFHKKHGENPSDWVQWYNWFTVQNANPVNAFGLFLGLRGGFQFLRLWQCCSVTESIGKRPTALSNICKSFNQEKAISCRVFLITDHVNLSKSI